MGASHSSPTISILDLPPELISEITQPAYIGRSTQYILPFVCKYFRTAIPPQPHPQYPIIHAAAADGHHEIIIHELSAGQIPSDHTMHLAAANGHLHVLKYLVDIGLIWTNETTNAAVENGHLDVFKYADDNNYEYDEFSVFMAASNGHLEIIKWAYIADIPVRRTRCNFMDDYLTCFDDYYHTSTIAGLASTYGHIHILDWIFHNVSSDWVDDITGGIRNGYGVPVLLWILKNTTLNKCYWYCTASICAKIDVLECLHEHDCPGAAAAKQWAIHNGDQKVIAWFDSKGI